MSCAPRRTPDFAPAKAPMYARGGQATMVERAFPDPFFSALISAFASLKVPGNIFQLPTISFFMESSISLSFYLKAEQKR
jgi:hypothetical protein